MNVLTWLVLYSAAIMLVSLLGGQLPLLGKVPHSRLQFYLSASAGVMLGASFFHVMPEAMELAGESFGWWMALGVVGLFTIERFVAPHTHEIESKLQANHEHEPGCEHDHAHRAAPTVAGWMAVLGLTIHTFMNGVGLAGAVQSPRETTSWMSAIPGFAMFLAIALHKPADALAISTVLSRKGVSHRMVGLVQFGFAAMIPLGAGAFCLFHDMVQQGKQSYVTGAALAFSAGTFLFVALSDLLPEVQFHRHDRVPLFLSLIGGVALMGGIALLENLGNEESSNRDKAHAGEVDKPDSDH
jgi:zinc and cadmium transporter